MKILKVPIERVEPWDKNPRKIHPEDFERLKRQIKKLGVYKPLVCYRENGKYIILGGNMRIRALRELGFKEVDISLVNPKSETEKIEYSLSDNDRAGYYDDQALAELISPYVGNLDLDDFKIDLGEAVALDMILEDLSLDETEESQEEGITDVNSAFTADQLVELMTDDILSLDIHQIEKRIMSLSMIAYQFNRLALGKRDGYWISIFHNPHRFYVQNKNHKNPMSLIEKKVKKFAKNLARFIVVCEGRVVLPHETIKYTMTGQYGAVTVNEFAPWVARDLVKEYTNGKDEIKVLDPCHGWGGRLIGALASMKRVHYVGIDPAEATHRGLRKLANFLLSAEKIKNLGSSVTLICDGYETARIPKGPYDFAFTSPPYFDLERYDDGNKQAWKKYKSIEEFNRGFLRTLIAKTLSLLSEGAAFVLNVSADKYDMGKTVEAICKELGFYFRVLEGYRVGGIGIGKRASSEDYEYGEPFFEIRRYKQ